MAKYLLLLFLAFLPQFASSEATVSINCGSSETYTDENSIYWTGDDGYIVFGDSHTVEINPGSTSQVMSTLRAFSLRNKNCYPINASDGEKVLVRASFFYGNYDGKESPPTFDLHLDGNHWQTVETSIDEVTSFEAIYVVRGNSLSVCVAQTLLNQIPFISALEVRSLKSTMYDHSDANFALLLRKRVAYGANESVRYLDDPYDRIWVPASATDIAAGFTKVASDAILTDSTYIDKPPTAVLQNAVVGPDSTTSMVIDTNLPDVNVPILINIYFSEVIKLDSTQKRSFLIDVNNISSSTDPIIPPYGSEKEYYFDNMTASSKTKFTLVPTSDSTLPPLINAMEVFMISDKLTDGTNSKDVEGLIELQNEFKFLQEWNGDPCLPATFTWDWLNCSSDKTPRVTALDLSDRELTGNLPDFSGMDALQTINLRNNSISGEIPDFLGTFLNLKELNLADNDFSGSIPSSLSENTMLKLVVSGNQNLCVSGKSCQNSDTETPKSSSSSSGKKSNKLPVILGTTISIFTIFWVIV